MLVEAIEQKQAERVQAEQTAGAVEDNDGQDDVDNTDSADRTLTATVAVGNDDTANEMNATQNSVSCEAPVYIYM